MVNQIDDKTVPVSVSAEFLVPPLPWNEWVGKEWMDWNGRGNCGCLQAAKPTEVAGY